MITITALLAPIVLVSSEYNKANVRVVGHKKGPTEGARVCDLSFGLCHSLFVATATAIATATRPMLGPFNCQTADKLAVDQSITVRAVEQSLRKRTCLSSVSTTKSVL